ncbi:hypothetical protein AAFF_G00181060 [Aldrovandia affinis]|uniref:DUF1720 domain-containing protein n=1 Tax=Aldrovandia affinis TaxID=143900 RepID=A0AAD7WVG6_9TELE|nr:hypothetical protein AAFF_G00181060 [Aldrovandia affinis]
MIALPPRRDRCSDPDNVPLATPQKCSKRRWRERTRSSASSRKRSTSSGPPPHPPPSRPRPRPPTWGASALPSRAVIDVDAVLLENPPRSGADPAVGLSGLRGRRGRLRGRVYETSDLPSLIAIKPQNTGAVKPQKTSAVKPQNTGAVKPQNTGAVKPQSTSAVKPQNTGAGQPQNAGAAKNKYMATFV